MKKHVKKPYSYTVFNIIAYVMLTILCITFLVPFLMMFASALSDNRVIQLEGYKIFPEKFTLSAFQILLLDSDKLLRSFFTSVFITVAGTACCLFCTSMTGYVLSRQDFKYRNKFSFFFFFTTLFNGGLLATYIFMVRYLHVKNTVWGMLLPLMFNVFYIMIMRSFMASIPFALIEAAKIDGADDFKIFMSIVAPLCTNGLITVALFAALEYWNDWYNAMLYITNESMYPLQYMMYTLVTNSSKTLSMLAGKTGLHISQLPSETLKLAVVCITVLPVLLLYPFAQKYFRQGVAIGAVKG